MKKTMQPRHGRPISRRDFLAQGFIGLSTTLFVPDLLFPKRAFGTDPLATLPYLIFDCAGGMSMPGNFLAGNQRGTEDLLASYDVLGWNPRAAGALDRRFGLPMSALHSRLLQGLLQSTSAEAQARLRMGCFCHFSQDDSGINKASAVSLITRVGFRGRHIEAGLGGDATPSGGRTGTPIVEARLRPLHVTSINDIAQALSLGPAFLSMPTPALTNVGSASLRLSELQSQSFSRRQGARALRDSVTRAYEGSRAYVANAPEVDPRALEVFRSVYALTPETAPNDESAVSAAIVMNVLNQTAGPGVISIGGCDYHQSDETTPERLSNGDAKDLEIGTQIGRAVEAAHRLRRPLFFQLLTDGGVTAAEGRRSWTGDAGDKSMTVIGYYSPTGARETRRLQVGHYTNGQSANLDTLIGSDTSKVAYAVLANYLNLIGRIGDFERIAAGTGLTNQNVDSLLVFA